VDERENKASSERLLNFCHPRENSAGKNKERDEVEGKSETSFSENSGYPFGVVSMIRRGKLPRKGDGKIFLGGGCPGREDKH